MRLWLRFIGLLFAGGTILFLVGITAAAGLVWHFSRELPDYSQLQDYEPAVMTRVHAADGSLLGRICQGAPALHPDPGGAEARHQRFHRGGRQELLRAQRHRLPGHRARRLGLHPALWQRTAAAGRLDHHPAGRQELPPDQRAVLHAQDQGSAARDEDRAHLLQGEDPRALSQRNLSRRRRLWRGGGVAPVFRQVGARADAAGSRLSRRAPEGSEQL